MDWSDPEAVLLTMGAGQPGRIPMPEPEIVSASQVRKQAKARIAAILEGFQLLKSILDRFEGVIQKRWAKKTKQQRRKILLASWGNSMSPTHRPDFAAFRKEAEPTRGPDSELREAYLWPSINEEDLTRPKTLPLMLNARGHAWPCEFAAADGEAMHMGILTGTLVPVLLYGHVMMFSGRKTHATYGQLISWDDDPHASDWLSTGKGADPGEGLLILECQERIMRFLVKCAQGILHDVSREALHEAPVQPRVSSLLTESAAGFTSLAVMAAEAPYRVPANLDFARIETLLAVAKDGSADHLWSLREDPAYFAEHMHDARENRQEMIKDANGQPHPLFRYGRDDILWGRVFSNEVNAAYVGFETLSELHQQAATLTVLQQKYAGKLSPEKDLPEEYLDAILTFREFLMYAVPGLQGILRTTFIASPPWRVHFTRQPQDDPEDARMRISPKRPPSFGKTETQLLWLAQTLWEDGNQLSRVRMSDAADELQRLIESDHKGKVLISRYIARALSEFFIITACLRQLEIFQPWSSMFESQVVDREDSIQAEYAQKTRALAVIVEALPLKDSPLARVGMPLIRTGLKYPVDKQRTRENVQLMQAAERNLDAFWRRVDELVTKGGVDRSRIGDLLRQKALRRTPDWEERPDLGPQNDVSCELTPLSEIYFDLERRTERTINKSRTTKDSKVKQKTRGDHAAQALPADIAPNDLSEDIQPTFQVDDRALKVFRTLFHAPSANGTPGEIPWLDFVHALTATGFRAEKLYGSVWQFSPTRLDVERSIHFHEPHPGVKIPYHIARRHGRRLARAYGWHGGMFQAKA